MSDRTLRISIQANDAASPAFRKISDSSKTMGQALKEAGTSGAGLDKVARSATQMGQAIQQGATQGSAALKTMGASAREVEDAYRNVGQALAAFGAGGTFFLGSSLSAANSLQSSMANVNSIAQLSKDELGSLTGQVRDLAVEMGQKPTGLADGLYEIQSSGFSAGEALKILETSTVAAGAGLTNTATSGRAITAVLNAYGLEASEAGNVSDLLFATVNEGSLSFEGLANNLGNILPIAAAIGVEFEEVSAAMAEMTLQGISAAQAETGLAAAMRSALNPTAELTEAVQSAGYASAEALIQAEGLAGLLTVLESASGGSSAALLELLGTSEATTAVMALLSNGVEAFTGRVGDMSAAARDGATTAEVFAIQTQTTAFALDVLSASATDFKVAIGEALQPVVTPGIDVASASIQKLTDAFDAMPASAQSAVAGVAGLISVTSLAAGGFLILLPRIVETRAALQTLGGASGILSSLGGGVAGLVAKINPLTIGITAAAAAGYVLYQSWQEGQAEAQAFQQSLSDLEMTFETLRRQGDTELAAMGESMGTTIDYLDDRIVMFREQMTGGLGFEDWQDQRWLEETGREFNEFTDNSSALAAQLRAEWFEVNDVVAISTDQMTALNLILEDALEDPSINAEAWISWAQGLLEGAKNGEQLAAAIELIESTPLSDFARNAATDMDTLNASMEETMATAEKVSAIFDAIPTALDDLRIEGGDEIAAQIEEITAAFDTLFNPSSPYMSTDFEQGGAFVTLAQQAIETSDITEESAASLEGSFDRIIEKMSSGEFDNPAIMAALTAIFTDPSLSPDQRVAEIAALSNSMADYSVALSAVEEAQRAAFTDFISNGDNILDFWLQMEAGAEVGAAAFDGTQAQLEAFQAKMREEVEFRALVGLADDLADAGTALDGVLTIFGQIDSLGQRFDSSVSIADALIGEPGEWAVIDDLITQGRISQEEYNAALTAGVNIQTTQGEVQSSLNTIRAMQIPLLAEEAAAYQDQIRLISELPALEQRRALALQDSAVQAQLATAYSTAYSASLGEIPTEVASSMIISSAEADPVIEDLLLNMGLIEEGADGELRVNFPDGETVQSSIMALTDSIDRLFLQLGGDPLELQVEADTAGAEAGLSAIEGLIRDADGRVVRTSVEADTADAAAGISAVDTFYRELDGRVVSTGITADTAQAQSSITETINRLGGLDGTTATATLNATDNASGVTRNAQGVVSSLTGKTVPLAATDGVTAPANTAKSSVNSLSGKSVTLSAVDAISGAASAAARAINSLSSKTVYLTAIYRNIGASAARAYGSDAHGGVVGFASGGMVPFWAGENGPEVAHFAGGGSALLPYEGMYAAPPMTYISPNNAVSNSYGGTFAPVFNYYGSGGDRGQMNQWFEDEAVPALIGAMSRAERSQGVLR